MERCKKLTLFAVLFLLLGERGGDLTEAKRESCIRHLEKFVVHRTAHNFGYLSRMNELVQGLINKDAISPTLGEILNRQIRTATRGVCEIPEIVAGSRNRSSAPVWGYLGGSGRIGWRRRRSTERRYTVTPVRKPRQALVSGVLAAVGLLEIGRVLQHLIQGQGYGANYDDYLNRVRATEAKLDFRISRLEENLRKMERELHGATLSMEIQSILDTEREEWDAIRTLNDDLRGNMLLVEAFDLAEKMMDKRGWLNETEPGEIVKIRIPRGLRTLEIFVRPHSVCRWATIRVTAVTGIPSRGCYRLAGEWKNFSRLETDHNSCLIAGNLKTSIDLADGSKVIPTNIWERKTRCEKAFEDGEAAFIERDGDIYGGAEEEFRASSSCATRHFTTRKFKNITLTPRASCKGVLSINGEGGTRAEWIANRLAVLGAEGVTGALVEDTDSWIHHLFDEVVMDELKGWNEADELDEEEFEESDSKWVETINGKYTGWIVGSGLASLVLCVSIYTGLKWWKKRKHERNRTTYICNVKVCDDLKLHADDEKVEADRDAEGEQLERITNELEKIRLELDKIPDVEDI